jgi:hypothetical protein
MGQNPSMAGAFLTVSQLLGVDGRDKPRPGRLQSFAMCDPIAIEGDRRRRAGVALSGARPPPRTAPRSDPPPKAEGGRPNAASLERQRRATSRATPRRPPARVAKARVYAEDANRLFRHSGRLGGKGGEGEGVGAPSPLNRRRPTDMGKLPLH